MNFLKNILDRVKRHESRLLELQNSSINPLEFEKHLLEEVNFVSINFEKKLSDEIIYQEKVLKSSLNEFRKIVLKKNIDSKSLENILYTEFNKQLLDNNML